VATKLASHIRRNAVAYVALFVALSGTAAAATSVLPVNSVGTAQLKNGAVTGQKVANDTLTGANIKASTLGTVPNAANASKLGGKQPSAFQSRVTGTCPSGSAVASIATAGTVTCQSANVTQEMGGSAGFISSNVFLAPSGVSSGSVLETDAEAGTSALPSTAANLWVSTPSIPLSAGWIFTLRVNGANTNLSCLITTLGSTPNCSDTTDTVTIPAGATVDLAMTETGGGVSSPIPITFGWTDATT
jgi:hypothetical protein